MIILRETKKTYVLLKYYLDLEIELIISMLVSDG